MRFKILIGFVAALASSAASSRMIVVLTDPMTMDRRTVVIASRGPDRAYLCMLPPGDAGCRAVQIKRRQRR
jgi:hypothetical protein